MDAAAHGLRDPGACGIQGIIDIEPDNEAVIFVGSDKRDVEEEQLADAHLLVLGLP
jgi:hypothetical protein